MKFNSAIEPNHSSSKLKKFEKNTDSVLNIFILIINKIKILLMMNMKLIRNVKNKVDLRVRKMKDLNKIVTYNIKNKLDEIKISQTDFATKLGTSLFLHDLVDRDFLNYTVTVPYGFLSFKYCN
jgi:hypothetical protein